MRSPSPRRDAAWLLAAVAVGLLLLSPLLSSGFITDDYQVMRKAYDYLSGDGGTPTFARLPRLLAVYAEPPDPRFQLYRPTVFLTFGLHLLTTGPSAPAFMVANLGVHVLSAWLLLCLLRRLLPAAPASGLGAAVLLFLISPLQVEPLAWSAARSDTMGLMFGLGALLARVRRPRQYLVPALLAAASLTCKESSLAFLLALVVVDGRALAVEPAAGAYARRLLHRSWPWAVLAVTYVVVRFTAFDTSYNRRGLSDYLGADLPARYLRSLVRFAAPVSENVLGGSWLFPVVSGLFLLGFLGVVVPAVRHGLARQRGTLLLAAVLFAVPFGLGVMVNEITAKLVHSRAVYAGVAGLAMMVALAAEAARGSLSRWAPIGLLILLSATLVVPGTRLYAEAYESMQRTLDSVRVPMRERASESVSGIAILGYRDRRYFGGAFNMAGSFRRALQRPFTGRDYFIQKVLGVRPGDAVGDYTSFSELMASPTDGIAVFAMAPDESGDMICDVVNLGRWCRVEGARLDLSHPGPGATLELDASTSRTLTTTFRLWSTGLEPAAFGLGFVNDAASLGDFRIPPEMVRSEPSGEGSVHTIVLPGPLVRGALGNLAPGRPYGWFATAYDERGGVVARTEIRLVYLASKRGGN